MRESGALRVNLIQLYYLLRQFSVVTLSLAEPPAPAPALPAAVRDVFSSLDLKLISQVLALFTVPCWSTSQKVMQTIFVEIVRTKPCLLSPLSQLSFLPAHSA